MMSPLHKYDAKADRFTAEEYGDPARYLGHRAGIVRTLGPPLSPGDRVLDLACADASFAGPLLGAGLAYTGLDASERMVEVARRRVAGRARIVLGDLLTYRPDEPVAATVCFRSLHFVPDRRAFFAHVAGYTEKKLLFDFDPRRCPPAEVCADLAAAGLDRVELRPFFVPQHAALPGPLAAALRAAERAGPLARALLRLRFSYIAAALPGTRAAGSA